MRKRAGSEPTSGRLCFLAVVVVASLSWLFPGSLVCASDESQVSSVAYSATSVEDPGPILNDVISLEWPEGAFPQRSPLGTESIYPPGLTYDVSDYMLGAVAVGVILTESVGGSEDWTEQEKTEVYNEIVNCLNWWVARKNEQAIVAPLQFVLNTVHLFAPVEVNMEPIEMDGTLYWQWANEALKNMSYEADWPQNLYDYANALRNNLGTDWAVVIFVADSSNDPDGRFTDSRYAFAMLGGPLFQMTYDNGSYGISKMDKVAAHELGHVFWALDEYSDGYGCNAYYNCTYRSGYLDIQNQNCNYVPCLLNVPSIMRGGNAFEDGQIDPYAKAQIGWNDGDHDLIPDVVDAPPSLELHSDYSVVGDSDTLFYQGHTEVGLVHNTNSQFQCNNPAPRCNDASVSRIATVEYRLDEGTWTQANGDFNSGGEFFDFHIGPLSAGSHSVQVRSGDSSGLFSQTLFDSFVVADRTPPEVSVVRPNGGEVFYQGSQDTIRWVATDNVDVDSVSIYYSTDGGATFANVIATGEPNDSLYTWNVPDTPSADCIVKVVAYDTSENSGEDVSDAVFSIEAPARSRRSPAIAFGGTNYLVVWEQEGEVASDIYGARIGGVGNIVDADGIPISTINGNQVSPAIGSDGVDFLVAWVDGDSRDVHCTLVTSEEGYVVEPGGKQISRSSFVSVTWPKCAMAYNGEYYLVVWTDERNGNKDIYGARVGPAGQLLDPFDIAISTADGDQYLPSVAFDGTNFLVVWTDGRNGYLNPDVYGARVSASGEVLDTDGLPIATGSDAQAMPAIRFDGTNYLVVWVQGCVICIPESTDRYVYGARVSTQGVVLDPGGISISAAEGDQLFPRVAFDGTNYFVVWEYDSNSSSSYIYGARVGTSGGVLDTLRIPISTLGSNQRVPDAAFDGTNYLVVWEDDRKGEWTICAARVDPSGAVLDPGGFTGMTFATASATAMQGYVKLTWRMAVGVPTSSFVIQRSQSPDDTFIKLELPISKGSGFSFSCADHSVQPGKTYWYRIVLVGTPGEVYGPIEVHVDAVPTAYQAYQSYPNPFNPLCTIRYDIPQAGKVNLNIFDVNGSHVRTLVDCWREPGVYSEVWDGKRDDGSALSSGIYFYSLKAGEFVATHKMVMLK